MNVRAKLTVLATAALAFGIGWTACTSETEQGGGEKPIPGNNNGERREVLLSLNNKLALRPVGSKGASDTQPDTKAIATPDENAIATLDVYIFGSDREDGTYTYQERFAYRADGTGNLPEGATALSLATSETDGSVTTALLSLRKGLFVKLNIQPHNN